jgi:hypothetical protein
MIERCGGVPEEFVNAAKENMTGCVGGFEVFPSVRYGGE